MDGDIQRFTIQLTKPPSTLYSGLPHASTCLNRCAMLCRHVEYDRHFELTVLVCCRLDLPVYSSKEELEETLHLVRGTLTHPMTGCECMTDVMGLFVSAGHSNGRHGLQQSLGIDGATLVMITYGS